MDHACKCSTIYNTVVNRQTQHQLEQMHIALTSCGFANGIMVINMPVFVCHFGVLLFCCFSVEMLTDDQISSLMLDQEIQDACEEVLGTPISEISPLIHDMKRCDEQQLQQTPQHHKNVAMPANAGLETNTD
jgi:hypothetical protein